MVSDYISCLHIRRLKLWRSCVARWLASWRCWQAIPQLCRQLRRSAITWWTTGGREEKVRWIVLIYITYNLSIEHAAQSALEARKTQCRHTPQNRPRGRTHPPGMGWNKSEKKCISDKKYFWYSLIHSIRLKGSAPPVGSERSKW